MAASPKNALILGATSSLAITLAHHLAEQGTQLVLVARNSEALMLLKEDLMIRYNNPVATITDSFDHLASSHTLMYQAETLISEKIETCFWLVGTMGGNQLDSTAEIAHLIHSNFTLAAQLLTQVALHMAETREGSIIVVSSVAGDRGRKSNYLYGAAKAGLSTFAAGLRHRFFTQGVHVLTVKPGFIDTPMTFGLKSPLIASRTTIVKGMLHALHKRKDCVYLPWFWRYIMLIIIHLPEAIFKRLSL